MEWLELELELALEPDHDEDDLKTLIAESVVENESDFLPIIGAICAQLNDRADYASDTFNVIQVDLDKPIRLINGLASGSGYLQAVFEWTAYYGCDDMDLHDEVQEVWEFQLENQMIHFRLQIPAQRIDEF